MEFEVGKKYTGKNKNGEIFLIQITKSRKRDIEGEKINRYSYETLKGNTSCTSFEFDDGSLFADRLKPYEDLPRICYILGGEDNPLKIGEHFRIQGYVPGFWIDKNGHFEFDGENFATFALVAFAEAINHPEKIIRSLQFSDDEKAFMRLYVGIGLPWFARDNNTHLFAYVNRPELDKDVFYDEKDFSMELPKELLPQITFKNSPFNVKEHLESEGKNDG